jgi:hypothetical protein
MYENLIPPIIILSVLISIVIIPALLYAGFRKIADPVLPWHPLLLAVIALLVMGGVLGFMIKNGTSLIGTVAYYVLMITLIALAAMTPYFWFGKRTGIDRPWLIVSLLSFVGLVLWFLTTMGESPAEGPFSPFFPALPLTGWLLDGLAAILHIGNIVYSATLPVYPVLMAVGLYLEVLIIATLVYVLLGWLIAVDKGINPK